MSMADEVKRRLSEKPESKHEREECFENEFGNRVCVSVGLYDAALPGIELIKTKMRGPASDTTNIITVEEARVLNRLLTRILATAS